MPGTRRSRSTSHPPMEAHRLDLDPPGDGSTSIEYRLIRSPRRLRTIEVAVHEGAVTVRAPARAPQEEIQAVVRQRAPWILRRLADTPPPSALSDGAVLPYRGRDLTVTVQHFSGDAPAVHRDLFGLHVELPGDPSDGALREALTRWFRQQAEAVIPPHVLARAAETGRVPNRVLIRDQRRRWGSCAADGTLRLNWRLVMLDEALMDYVAVHELAHLDHPHHGAGFWRAVERVLPEHRELRRRLREEGRALPL